MIENKNVDINPDKFQFKISEKPIVIFDFETTGLNPELDKIIEVGAIKIIGNKIVDEFWQLYNPNFPLTEKITELTGITDDMLKDKPTLEASFHEFMNFLGEDCILGAHNISFDIQFLYHTTKRLYNKEIEYKGFCTYLFAQKIFPIEEIKKAKKGNSLIPMPLSHKLIDLCSFYQIPLGENAHRADADAKATARLFFKLMNVVAKANYDCSIVFDLVKDIDVLMNAAMEKQWLYDNAKPSSSQSKFMNDLLSKNPAFYLKIPKENITVPIASSIINTLLAYEKEGIIPENDEYLSVSGIQEKLNI